MPTQKDLKRVVRARMKKTGESYTAARARILEKPARTRTASARTATAMAASPAVAAPPRPSDYARLAGMSDAAIKARTGCAWKKWVDALDAHGAGNMSHREIAKLVHARWGIDGWWAQTVTVGYERIRGRREIGQRIHGTYAASKSRTFPVPVADLYRACADPRWRTRWLDGVALTPRTSVRNQSVRLVGGDATRIQLWFTAKGDARSQVAVQHEGLPDRESRERMKAFWTERLAALGELFGD
jgi:uncharacterized protein YndB with AHSA1/START domain